MGPVDHLKEALVGAGMEEVKKESKSGTGQIEAEAHPPVELVMEFLGEIFEHHEAY